MKKRLPKAVREFRARLREQLATRELPAWKPLRFEGDGIGWTISQERVEQPDFVKTLLQDLPTGDFTVARYDRERLRRELSPEHFATVNALFEHLLVQAQVAWLAVQVAESTLASAGGGHLGGLKTGKKTTKKAAVRKSLIAKRAQEIEQVDGPLKRQALARQIAERSDETDKTATAVDLGRPDTIRKHLPRRKQS